MRLGIDFGTTRIVAAAADRGNYPVVAFECPDGASREWYPPLVAVRGERRLYGWDAWAAQSSPGYSVVRSLKRCLAGAGPHSSLAIGSVQTPIFELLTGLLTGFREDLMERSSLSFRPGDPMEVFLGVPANANGNQRFLTVEAFRQAGFSVLGLLNEPSAASIEYVHRQGASVKPGEKILVYDLGGGTFDASLVERSEASHSVVASDGISTLGGDDFDEILAGLALEATPSAPVRTDLSATEEFLLLEECRERKEALHPNSRKLVIDLDRVREGAGQASVLVSDFYRECELLILETIHATEDLLSGLPDDAFVSLYITGGGSELPLVNRLLKERFGRRVKRSAYTRSATAIGLAIQAQGLSGYQLKERFTRHFGVWREGDAGRTMIFDSLFDRATQLPAPGAPPLVQSRRYKPVHNIGHFRYLECSRRSPEGQPVGDLTYWDTIRFPFDPAIAERKDIEAIPVDRSQAAQVQSIEEQYSVDASGAVTVAISNVTAGYSREFKLGRWAVEQTTVVPPTGRRKKAAQ